MRAPHGSRLPPAGAKWHHHPPTSCLSDVCGSDEPMSVLCFSQDLNKRLSLPADIRIPDGYLEKLQLSSPPFDQPLSRRSRRASLVSVCVFDNNVRQKKTWFLPNIRLSDQGQISLLSGYKFVYETTCGFSQSSSSCQCFLWVCSLFCVCVCVAMMLWFLTWEFKALRCLLQSTVNVFSIFGQNCNLCWLLVLSFRPVLSRRSVLGSWRRTSSWTSWERWGPGTVTWQIYNFLPQGNV